MLRVYIKLLMKIKFIKNLWFLSPVQSEHLDFIVMGERNAFIIETVVNKSMI